MISRTRPRRTAPLCALLIALVIDAASAATANAGTIAIEWDPSPDPSVVGYRVSVGTSPGVYTETFDVGSATSFSYQATGNGTYFLAVASYAEGPSVGPLSDPVSALVSGPPPGGDARAFYGALWRDTAAPSNTEARFTVAEATGIAETANVGHPFRGAIVARPGASVCWSPSSECMAAQTVARSSASISSLTIAPDNRQYFVEGHRQIRVIASNVLQTQPVLVVDSATVQVNQLALDPAFAATGVMYVSETETLRDGRREFRLVRYRVLADQARNRAVIFSTVLPSGSAWFAVTPGYIFVAVPGTLLRLNLDGSVPPNQLGSPIYATGYSVPTAVAFDGASQHLWLTGVDDRGQVSISTQGGMSAAALTPVTAMSATEVGGTSYLFLAFDDGATAKAQAGANGLSGGAWQLEIGDGLVRDVAASASGDLFVAVEKRTSTGVPAMSVLHLAPAP